MKVRVFYKNTDATPWIRENSSEKLSELERRLSELKKEIANNPKEVTKIEEIRKTKEQILALRREINRTKRFTEISDNKLAEGQSSLDTISAANLMKMDKEVSMEKRGEFLSKSFLYKRTTDGEWNIFEEPTDGKNIKEGDTLFVDLWKDTGKKSAYWRIGLGQMLWTDVWYVKVDGKIGIRANINWRIWYYTKPSPDGYIAVFTGTTVSIPSATEIWDFEKNKPDKLTRNTNQEESNKMNDVYIERLEQVPETSNIEASTLMRESYDFLKNKGLSEEQISGILANEYQESRCNPRANNNNISFGIFQWKPDRIEKIKKATGIDIHTANHIDQLNALWWEMTEDPYEKKVYSLLKETKTPAEAASVFVTEFERPADKIGEPIKRGKIAENIYNQFRFINNPELANLAEWPANQAIIRAALEAQGRWDILGAEHCTDWVDKIYSSSIGMSVYSTKLYYNGITRIDRWTWLWWIPATGEISNIKPWMHIIVDKPPYNEWKTHSIIALSSPIDWMIKVVSYPNGRMPPKIEMYDLYAQSRWEKNGKPLRIQWV